MERVLRFCEGKKNVFFSTITIDVGIFYFLVGTFVLDLTPCLFNRITSVVYNLRLLSYQARCENGLPMNALVRVVQIYLFFFPLYRLVLVFLLFAGKFCTLISNTISISYNYFCSFHFNYSIICIVHGFRMDGLVRFVGDCG